MNTLAAWRVAAPTLVVLAIVARVGADSEQPLREATSENGRFVLRIEFGTHAQAGHSCTAALLARPEAPPDVEGSASEAGAALPGATPAQAGRTGGRSPTGTMAGERPVWRRRLLNEIGPVQAFVRDDGEFVVTLDEVGRGGARHALVVYGPRGRPREFALAELLQKSDWPHVRVQEHQVRWLDGAKFAFEDEWNQFAVRLAWGRTLYIDLKALVVLDEAGRRVRPDRASVPAAVLAELRRPAGDAAGATTQAVAAALADADAQRVQAARSPGGSGLASAVGDSAGESGIPSGDATFTCALSVPWPNREQKTDYLAWINSLGVVDGPDAAPLYAQAMSLFQQANTLDPNFDAAAAAAGKPEVLLSEEYAAWRAAHGEAVALFREAAQYPAKSCHLVGSDGGMLYEILLPHLAQARGLARACVAEGRYQLLRGNPEEAAACYLDAVAAGKHFGDEPVLISNLVGLAMQRNASDALLDLAADPAASGLDFAQLAAAANERSQPVQPVGQTIQFERAAFLDFAQRLWDRDETGEWTFNGRMLVDLLNINSTGASSNELKPVLAGVGTMLRGFDAMVAAGNAYYDRLERAVALPYPQASHELAAIEDWLSSGRDVHPVLQVISPALSRVTYGSTRIEATRRAAVVVTQLQAFRQQTGFYPDTLDVLDDAATATNPFTARPFEYQRVGDTFELYSTNGGTKRFEATPQTVLDAVATTLMGTVPEGETVEAVYWPRPAPGH